MNTATRVAIVIVVMAAAIGVAVLKSTGPASTSTDGGANLPRLVDLGSDRCMACRMMMRWEQTFTCFPCTRCTGHILV